MWHNFQDYFSSNISNAKKLWSGIKSIISNKNQISNKINGIRDKNGNMISNSEKISNVFNDYFINVADNIEKAIPRTSKSPMDYLKASNPYSMFLSPTTKFEVEDVISNLDSTKSIGPNSIPIKLLKVLKPYISQYLEKLVNQSFVEGHFPSKLRSAKVLALFKKGNSELASNYRPISLLPLFSKVFERIMYNKLYKFLTANNIIYPLQFGFQKDRAIDHALIGMTEMIRLTLDNKRFGCGILVDLQKAFDTVNHNILIAKLEHYGVRGNVLQWFKSYLYDRAQYVSINGTSSTPLRVTSGVPQGSVLGPLLFLIFINDMPNASKKLKFYLFADDTSIYYESETLNEMITRVNKELKLVKKWLNANKLFLNIEKTNYVIFHSTQIKIPPDVRIKIGNKTLKRAKYVKCLGILLDEYLNWKHHITELSKKLSRACGILFKIRNFLPTNLLIDVYNSLFMSYLQYGIVVWGLTFASYIDCIAKVQKKAVRIISHQSYLSHSLPIFKELRLLRVSDIIQLKLLIFVYEAVNNIISSCFHEFFTYNSTVHSYNTRQSHRGDIFMVQTNSSLYGLKSIRYLGAKSWNELPMEIRKLSSKKVFEKQLKEYLIDSMQ